MQSRVVRAAKQTGLASQKSELNQCPALSNITTFVRCLRLLDLDRLPDWPSVTDDVFTSKAGQQNLQRRIKAVEWSLYRLFEIFDPKETQTKLRPFFPPLAPLQSLNLHAALFRALTELKKIGVLGKDVVLRKTMLDECKGDKFEEVLSTFALVVLWKTSRLYHPELGLDQIEHIPKEQLVPLILAHRHSLQQGLRQRQHISQRIRDYAAILAAEETTLQQRLEEVQQRFQPVDQKDLVRLSEIVRSAWVGDDRLSDILLGERIHAVGPLLQQSFESSWARFTEHEPTPEFKSNDLATELNERVGEQENRMKRWKTFYASMTQAHGRMRHLVKNAQPPSNPPFLRFDQHKALSFNPLQMQQPAEERIQRYHSAVLKSMHAEIAGLNSSDLSAKSLALKRDRNCGQALQIDNQNSTQVPIAHQGARAQDNLRIGSSAHKENPSGANTHSDQTPDSAPQIHMNEAKQEEDTQTNVHSGANPLGLSPEPAMSSQDEDVPSSPPVDQAIDGPPQVLNPREEDRAAVMVEPNPKRIPTSTLYERARTSLLPFRDGPSSPDVHDDSIVDGEDDESRVLPPLPGISAPRGTLLERTRQSMSLLPNPPPKPRGSRQSSVKQPRFSEVFPVNQFQTPGRSHTQQSGALSPRSGSSTPRDRLFSEEADYASVFKSRPRIAVSPSLSPERSNLGLDSLLADGVDDLDLEDNEDTPSRGLMRNA